jgi:MAP/microtubule affinity-regulating kinase
MTATETKKFIEMQKLMIFRVASPIVMISSPAHHHSKLGLTLPRPPLGSKSPIRPGQFKVKPLSLTTEPLKEKDELAGYILGKVIGNGAYAQVRQAMHRETRQQVAIKVYEKYLLIQDSRKQAVAREIKVLEKLNHSHVLKLHESVDCPKQIYLVMEFVRGASLLNYLKKKPGRRLEEEEAKCIFRQILLGIEYCHSLNVTHRDLKLENLLLDDQHNIRIIDFGFATCFPNHRKVKMFCGTPRYMAPEIVSRAECCGPPVDVWALGVLLYTMLAGAFPFRAANDAELFKAILSGSVTFPPAFPEAARFIIEQMLSVDPDVRPSVSDVLIDDWFISPESLEEGKVEIRTEVIGSCKNPFMY